MLYIITTVTKEQIIICVALLILNVVNASLGSLRTIFMAKQAGKITYLITLIDATMYAVVLKSMSSEGYFAIFAYVFGKVFGTMLADYVEHKIAIGVNDITLYVGDEGKMMELQELFLAEGYSSTANIGYIHDDKNRYSINIQLPRREMNRFYRVVDKAGISNPTMMIKEIKTVTGKIAERI